jgi:hypothetical protein
MSEWVEVEPAYGRDYKTQKAVKADWVADKDFRDTVTGRYLNKSDAERFHLNVVVRYDHSDKVMRVR